MGYMCGCTMEGGQVVKLGNAKINLKLISNEHGLFHKTDKRGKMNATFELECGRFVYGIVC